MTLFKVMKGSMGTPSNVALYLKHGNAQDQLKAAQDPGGEQEKRTMLYSSLGAKNNPEYVAGLMQMVRSAKGKDSGRRGFHLVLALDPNQEKSLSEEEATEYTKKFMEKNFKGYDYLAALHNDKEHQHIHILVNSVSRDSDRKLDIRKRDLALAKDTIKQLDQEFGLKTMDQSREQKKNPFLKGLI